MSKDIDEDTPLSSPTVPAAFMKDATPEHLDPATFDLSAFIGGIRPTRRTVTLHMRADLVGEMDEIAQRIDGLPDGPEVDALLERFEEARQGFLAATTYWTVERRSSEWLTKRWADYARANSITLDKNGDTSDRQARTLLLTDQLVGQLVGVKTESGQPLPGTVTFDALRALAEANEGEFNKLLYAMSDANMAMAQAAKVLTRDFSPRSSTARSGTAS